MNFIKIKGAKEHNLKNVDLELPKDKLIVFTGLSGSGKSTLAFDTIFAEGQRRYLESLSSYARQFLGQMEKPDVEYIEGLSPAIAIDQKTASRNPRSTVGTVTEIHDYLRLLYARIGHPHCPKCGREISFISVEEIVEKILEKAASKKKKDNLVEILAPLARGKKGEFVELFKELFTRGFSRIYIDGKRKNLADWKKIKLEKNKKHTIDLLIDKVEVSVEKMSRIFDSVETGLKFGDGLLKIIDAEKNEEIFNQKMSCPEHDISLPEMEPRFFSFNSPMGACPDCEGLGTKSEIDEKLVMPDENKTINQGAILPWSYKQNNYYGGIFRAVCQKFGISENTRIRDLSPEEKKILLYGPEGDYDNDLEIFYRFKSNSGYYQMKWKGVIEHLKSRYRKTQSDAVRKEIEKYMLEKKCSTCDGHRYREEVLWVKISGKNIAELSALSIVEAKKFVENITISAREKMIAGKIVKEICNRLSFLENVGLEYLTLGRTANTLSGGEAQRIRLASQIGSGLTGVLYILDEPSIGLHARDNTKLLDMLVRLRDLGNTVIVVEHDEETIKKADHIVDIGPLAGVKGGKIVHSGDFKSLLKNEKSLTAAYFSGKEKIETPKFRKKPKKNKILVVKGATQNNLKNITVEFPLGLFCCVTGVSGSGKSSLVEDVLYKWMASKVNRSSDVPGKVGEILGDHLIKKVVMVDQSPIGRTPRSNPATYTGAFSYIRQLFAQTQAAKQKGYSQGRFSFNVPGGRCENCKGDGFLKIEMQFMPDLYIPCDVCGEKKYNSETLRVKYREKNIFDVLDMTVNQAVEFFANHPAIVDKLKTLKEVGLGYIKLGQASTTISGGESQRIKLASELSKRNTGQNLYILDEPTTGLHFHDIKKLLGVLNRLVDSGSTVVVIEHNMDVIKSADWIIDLGPEGGENGGKVIVTGTPEELVKWHKESWTGKYLREYLGNS